MEKKSHLGKAGHFAAMAEFLLRGYNVAIPEVDVGDDVFVVDDREGRLFRVQVKTAVLPDATGSVQFSKIYRRQLAAALPAELTYVFALRRVGTWDFFILPRVELHRIRSDFELAPKTGKGPVPKVSGDPLTLTLTLGPRDARGWGTSFQKYLNNWSSWPQIKDGPGSTSGASP